MGAADGRGWPRRSTDVAAHQAGRALALQTQAPATLRWSCSTLPPRPVANATTWCRLLKPKNYNNLRTRVRPLAGDRSAGHRAGATARAQKSPLHRFSAVVQPRHGGAAAAPQMLRHVAPAYTRVILLQSASLLRRLLGSDTAGTPSSQGAGWAICPSNCLPSANAASSCIVQRHYLVRPTHP